MKLIKDWLTGKDGETFDPARGYLLGGVLVFLTMACYAVVARGQPWDPQAFGLGFGALLAGGGLGVRFKSQTEPGQN